MGPCKVHNDDDAPKRRRKGHIPFDHWYSLVAWLVLHYAAGIAFLCRLMIGVHIVEFSILTNECLGIIICMEPSLESPYLCVYWAN